MWKSFLLNFNDLPDFFLTWDYSLAFNDGLQSRFLALVYILKQNNEVYWWQFLILLQLSGKSEIVHTKSHLLHLSLELRNHSCYHCTAETEARSSKNDVFKVTSMQMAEVGTQTLISWVFFPLETLFQCFDFPFLRV